MSLTTLIACLCNGGMVFSMMYELNFLIFVGTSYIRRVNVSFHKFAYYSHAELWGCNNNSAIHHGILEVL